MREPIPNDLYPLLMKAPSFYEHNDQWFELTYAWLNGKVYTFEIDRKEQSDCLVKVEDPDEFLSSKSDNEDAVIWLTRLLDTQPGKA